VAITSGSLLQAQTVQQCGLFVDELFIDGVDHEYSLRLRKAGFPLYECADAILLHSPGAPRHHKFPGGKRFQTANYSPIRRYYQERNKIWIARHYARTFPRFCLRIFVVSLKDFIKIWLVEPDDKLRKATYFLRGTLDGIRGRYGKL
jgi:rhamnosyltransferase